jgi:hypothetical protein
MAAAWASVLRLLACAAFVVSLVVCLVVPPMVHLIVYHIAIGGVVAAVALLALIAPDVRSILRVGTAALLTSIAAFAMLTPWALCRTPPYQPAMCPLDADARAAKQRRRLQWAGGLAALVAILLAWPLVFPPTPLPPGAKTASPLRRIFFMLRQDAEWLVRLLPAPSAAKP